MFNYTTKIYIFIGIKNSEHFFFCIIQQSNQQWRRSVHPHSRISDNRLICWCLFLVWHKKIFHEIMPKNVLSVWWVTCDSIKDQVCDWKRSGSRAWSSTCLHQPPYDQSVNHMQIPATIKDARNSAKSLRNFVTVELLGVLDFDGVQTVKKVRNLKKILNLTHYSFICEYFRKLFN